jgi:hypothetical protein
MADEQRNSSKPYVGFAGLSSMVSDVDELITRVRRQHPEHDSARRTKADHVSTASPPSPQQSKDPRNTLSEVGVPRPGNDTPGMGTGIKWLVPTGIIGFLIWISSLEPTPQGSDTRPNTPSASVTSNREVTREPPREVRPPPPSSAARFTEQRPPVGTNRVHSTAELRYCLAESIRLDGADPMVDTRVGAEVDRFNAMVSDYNSRCGAFRYRPDDLGRARREVEAHRAALLADGRERFISGS